MSTTFANRLRVYDPSSGLPVTLDLLPDPNCLSDQHARFTTVAVEFPRPLNDTAAETAAALFGYAWSQHGAARRTGDVADAPVLWINDQTMVVTARMVDRPERTRSRTEATRDLFTTFLDYLTTGSPLRKDGERLVPPLGVDPATVRVYVST